MRYKVTLAAGCNRLYLRFFHLYLRGKEVLCGDDSGTISSRCLIRKSLVAKREILVYMQFVPATVSAGSVMVGSIKSRPTDNVARTPVTGSQSPASKP